MRTVVLLLAASLLGPARVSPASAQEAGTAPGSATSVHAGALTLGVRHVPLVTRSLEAGVVGTAGPHLAATIHRDGGEGLDVWASGYLHVAARITSRVAAVVRPLGAVLVTGGDFGTVYPSGEAGLEVRHRRLRVESVTQVIRVAGPEGSGDYRIRWIPLRVGIRL